MVGDGPVDATERRQVVVDVEGLDIAGADDPRGVFVIHQPNRQNVDPVGPVGGVEHLDPTRIHGIGMRWEYVHDVGPVNAVNGIAHRHPIHQDLDEPDLGVVESPTGHRKDTTHGLVRTGKLDLTERRLVQAVVDGHRTLAEILHQAIHEGHPDEEAVAAVAQRRRIERRCESRAFERRSGIPGVRLEHVVTRLVEISRCDIGAIHVEVDFID